MSAAPPANKDEMRRILAAQRAAFNKEGAPTAALRIDRINRALAMLLDNRGEISDALRADYIHRSRELSLLTDIAAAAEALKHARRHLRRWMRPRRRPVPFPLNLLLARARVDFQPKGVVGIMSPWNFPVGLTLSPLAGVFAAGNRAMIKPSEATPATSAAMKKLIQAAFDESEAAVVCGGADVGAAFSSLPFDHLIFTGGTAVGRLVMRAAADNLTPVTLELGGKSPAVVSASAPLAQAARRIMAGKTLNAGQICIAPDYALVPENRASAFAAAAAAAVAQMFPTIKDNPEYASLVNERHYNRACAMLDEAKARGCEIIQINPADEELPDKELHKLPPTLVLNPPDDIALMKEEIFAPILPIKTYSAPSAAAAYINARERPLALYYFGENAQERDALLAATISGGVAINETLWHYTVEDLPFGGVGQSGIGAYHGIDGFYEFSHKRAVYTQSPFAFVSKMLRPPFKSNKLLMRELERRLKR